jgi:hypothetical protein
MPYFSIYGSPEANPTPKNLTTHKSVRSPRPKKLKKGSAGNIQPTALLSQRDF